MSHPTTWTSSLHDIFLYINTKEKCHQKCYLINWCYWTDYRVIDRYDGTSLLCLTQGEWLSISSSPLSSIFLCIFLLYAVCKYVWLDLFFIYLCRFLTWWDRQRPTGTDAQSQRVWTGKNKLCCSWGSVIAECCSCGEKKSWLKLVLLEKWDSGGIFSLALCVRGVQACLCSVVM